MKISQRTIRLFLSSTFRDFGEERDLLVKRVFPALRAKLRDRFVELVLALQLVTGARLRFSGSRGVLQGEPGDWLVQYAPGAFKIVAGASFDRRYLRIPE